VGLLDQTFHEVQQLQQQVKTLQAQISTLATKQELQAQQAALQKLQTQFANHHHVVQLPPDPHSGLRGSMFTTINCPGIGQPCSLNSQEPGGITYGILLWPPGSSPGGNLPPPQPTNENTSGPQD